ncbi:MAG: hypothetical protein Q7T05_03685 [Dehalococcoidia bacterium]|nr:hypothetical protein [Dehalococcoidia bacterium]
MLKISVNLEVLNPRGNAVRHMQTPVSSSLKSLNGKKIGVLDNGKPAGKMLFPFVEEALKERFPDIQMRTWSVPLDLSPELKEPRLKEIAEYSDAVIALLGD